jgi:hypothetical protein
MSGFLRFNVPMAAIIWARNIEEAAHPGAFEAGSALHEAGLVAWLEPTDSGTAGLVTDDGSVRDVWVGIRHQFLVGECDCADADPQATSNEYLEAAAQGHMDRPELCAHAVAVALSAIAAGLPWDCAPLSHRPRYLRATRQISTPRPPLDITSVFPELAGLAKTAFRLHPRPGRPGAHDSSLGGPLLWPADEPWPACTTAHEGSREVPVPPEVTTWAEATEWALRNGAGVALYPDGSITTRVSDSRPPDPPSPLVCLLQLYARDVPDLPFPDGTDLLQVLWCPNEHGLPWCGPRPEAFWRRASDVASMLRHPPPPVFDAGLNARNYDPVPCLLHPEPVTEYPDSGDLPTALCERVEGWDRGEDADAPHLYWSALSTAPGTKALGYPRWIQGPRPPVCGQCGQVMEHLVTIASEETGNRDRWQPDDDLPEQFPCNFAPHGILIGDVGSMYLFTCTTCPDRPLGVSTQFT